ncbi:MAG: hypothetical protein TEF_17125 [Rhizobiales bacterium NRL2]|jgi:hypothetical protein|nr:MAG: hypothetical protein TEF_17125 [Rhizobiales bacterium NRL2]
MYAILDAPDDVLAIELSGTVTREDIQSIESACRARLERHETLGLFVDLTGLSDVTGDAIAEDIRFEMEMLSMWERFPHVAAVSDKKFVSAIVRFLNRSVAAVEFRAYDPASRDAAMAFASDVPAAPAQPRKAVRRIEPREEGVLAFEINGRVTPGDIDTIVGPLREATASGRRIDLFVRLQDYEGFDPAMLVSGSLFSAKIGAIRHVRRYALVGASDWMKRAVEAAEHVLPMEIRSFDRDDEDQAWAWLRS